MYRFIDILSYYHNMSILSNASAPPMSSGNNLTFKYDEPFESMLLNRLEECSQKQDIFIYTDGIRRAHKTTVLVKFAELRGYNVLEPTSSAAKITIENTGYKKIYYPGDSGFTFKTPFVFDEYVENIEELRAKGLNIITGYVEDIQSFVLRNLQYQGYSDKKYTNYIGQLKWVLWQYTNEIEKKTLNFAPIILCGNYAYYNISKLEGFDHKPPIAISSENDTSGKSEYHYLNLEGNLVRVLNVSCMDKKEVTILYATNIVSSKATKQDLKDAERYCMSHYNVNPIHLYFA